MLWGKKILQWTRTPQEAAEIMIHLNNKYALDGRNPNSYSGIFWVLGSLRPPLGACASGIRHDSLYELRKYCAQSFGEKVYSQIRAGLCITTASRVLAKLLFYGPILMRLGAYPLAVLKSTSVSPRPHELPMNDTFVYRSKMPASAEVVYRFQCRA